MTQDTPSSGYDTLAASLPDGDMALDILVSGVNCAGCIQKIESALHKDNHIRNARLNFSTRRLHIVWNGEAARANDYVEMVEKLGYGVTPYDPRNAAEEIKAEEKFLLLCMGVAGFAMGNIMLLSVGLWTTSAEVMGMATRDFLHWISALIAIPTVLFSGRPFFRSAYKALSNGHTNMDVPISLAITLASVMSLYETIRHGEHAYFDSAVMLMFFLLIGRYLDSRARANARSAATDLLSTLSGFAHVLDQETNSIKKIAIRDLREGMTIRVAMGEKFPVDGEIIEGETEIDTSLITGETLPRHGRKDDIVYAGTLNLSAPVIIRVSKSAEDSLLADIVRLMEKAGQGQAKYVRLADRMAKAYTPVVHALAAAGFLLWWGIIGAPWQDALMIAVTILIITCPCALGLAVPVVQVLATGGLMKRGILVKSGDALERLAKIDTVFLDKTGTLTLGQPQPDEIRTGENLKLAASLAAHSHHPLSRALSDAYHDGLYTMTSVKEHPGKGIEGITETNRHLRLGSRAWCGDPNAPAHDKMELWLHAEGQSPVCFTFQDTLRPDAASTIQSLQKSGLTTVLLSGDRQGAVESMASATAITEFYFQKTPPEKYALLEERKKDHHKVLMVGDGLNDAPVLAGADVSMAPGTALDMAQNAADIIFMGKNLSPVFDSYKTAVFSQKLVKENFALAILYNVIAVPLAFCGLVTPMVAAIAMSGSSLVVIANSFRLRLMS